MTTVAFDPFSEAVRANPYPRYAELRRLAPVYRAESADSYVVSRYEDVLFVIRHPELFSSSAMLSLMASGLGATRAPGGLGFSGADAARLGELVKQLPVSLPELLAARSLIAADPPVHGPMRSLVNRGFTPRRIAALEPRIRAVARAALAAVDTKGELDLMADLAIPLPVTVIAELLGVEPERRADFKRWSDCLVAGTTGAATGLRPELLFEVFRELNEYLTGVMAARRAEPRDDLITTLTRAEDGETALTPVEVMTFTMLLLIAGNETTTHLLGNAILALLANPAELARVRREPQLIPALVEEALRFDSPVQLLFRRATQEVELAGTKIPAGASVLPLLGSANRDDAQFPDADRFDVTRSEKGHVAFGVGIHFCLGASLARLEARVALEELLGRFASLERLERKVAYVDSFVLRGPKRLPLRFEVA
jgi:cytochrome P450